MNDKVEISYSPATRMYTIYRPATDERCAVRYDISEVELMEKIDCLSLELNVNDILTLLKDETIDLIIRPVNRRAAIEHTRKMDSNERH